MTIYGGFSASILAMTAQTSALSTVSQNIANMNTGGYKEVDTTFKTVLADSLFQQSDLGGVVAKTQQTLDLQGSLVSTGDDLDLAINGSGLFVLSSTLSGSGNTVYGRDGDFQLATSDDGTTVNVVDKNGYYLMGWAVDENGVTSSALSAISIDTAALATTHQETTNASLALNIPNDMETGASDAYGISVWDSNGTLRTVTLDFTHTDATAFDMAVSTADSGATVTAGGGTLTFDGEGNLVTPTSRTISITWSDGSTSSFELDMSETVSYAGDMTALSYSQNGYGDAELSGLAFDGGDLVASFDDGSTRVLYQIPVAIFTNVNGLEALAGNVYRETESSGSAEIVDPATSGMASLLSGVHELSNVDTEEQFAKMILVQTAYTMASTVFKTADEMLATARDLKA